ncbi:hypothetical protein MMC10_006808 [Thelotrema lepadinum]|nr:hypothetical protein [Thelotrema lepadinum]
MFSLKGAGYQLLHQTEQSKEEVGHDEPLHKKNEILLPPLRTMALYISVVLNIVFTVIFFQPWAFLSRRTPNQSGRSPYANLEWNTPIPFEAPSPFLTHNLTELRQLWTDISIDDGMIALPDTLASEWNLHPAQRFPWDDSKGIYFVNGFHSLHCLRSIHISLLESHLSLPQSRPFSHLTHCMSSLREDTLCRADDTPRYTTSSSSAGTGKGQVRMCRSWTQLKEWASGYNACYSYTNQTDPDYPQVLRFANCPAGSEYEGVVRGALEREVAEEGEWRVAAEEKLKLGKMKEGGGGGRMGEERRRG